MVGLVYGNTWSKANGLHFCVYWRHLSRSPLQLCSLSRSETHVTLTTVLKSYGDYARSYLLLLLHVDYGTLFPGGSIRWVVPCARNSLAGWEGTLKSDCQLDEVAEIQRKSWKCLKGALFLWAHSDPLPPTILPSKKRNGRLVTKPAVPGCCIAPCSSTDALMKSRSDIKCPPSWCLCIPC